MKHNVREYFSLNEYITFDEKKIQINLISEINVKLNRFEINKSGLKTLIVLKPEMTYDSYVLKIKDEILIEAQSKRACIYAWNLLESLVEYKKNQARLPIVVIKDSPSFKLRGIIEGFYFEPWSQSNRLEMVDFCVYNKLNTYMYAPKADSYHRKNWRELYPDKEFKALCEVIDKCQKHDVDFYYSISPGLDFKYSEESDFHALFNKLEQVINVGVKHFALLMDDIDYKLEGQDKELFKRPGLAHAFIANKVNQYLNERVEDYTFVMCPTEYFQSWDTEYRKDLKENMDSNVYVFWTGYNTVAEVITREESEIVKKAFGHELILWDNYPVNDMSVHSLFMGPIRNRSTGLNQSHYGMLTNPMNQWHLSKVPMITMADYMWNSEKYDADKSWDYALKQVVEHVYYDSFKLFCINNKRSILYYDELEEVEEAIKSEDYTQLDKYYEDIVNATKHLETITHKELLAEMKGWLERIHIDYELYQALKTKNEPKIKVIINKINDSKHEVGSNIAMKLAYSLGYIEKEKIYKYNRDKYWRM